MVDNITPDYYAIGVSPDEYIIDGKNLDIIPSNALGIFAYNNDDPLRFRYDTADNHSYKIVEQSYSRMVLRHITGGTLGSDTYLGGIVSPDGSIVYWVNETKPLP